MIKNTESHFWSKVKTAGVTDCWEWSDSVSRRYGQFNFDGKKQKTHRLAWKFAFGEIPTGLYVCHSCDNPLCCNPSHLFLGTALDNAADRDNKGRQIKGEKHYMYGNGHLRKGELNGRYKDGSRCS